MATRKSKKLTKAQREKAAKKKPRKNGNRGRSSSGQFSKGNTIGKGSLGNTNEPAKKLKQALIDSITAKDIKEIADEMISQAKSGDAQARKELFDRIWGRAPQSVEVSGADGEPIPVAIIDYSKVDLTR